MWAMLKWKCLNLNALEWAWGTMPWSSIWPTFLVNPTALNMKRFALSLTVCAAAMLTAPAMAQDATLTAAAKEAGALVTSTGLVYRAVKEGTGAHPTAADTVKVHYKGTFPDGKEFDSSYKRGTPIEFPLGGVIPCWTEGVQKMKVGGQAKLTCPSAIAYGTRGAGNVIPPNATLVFEVELLGIK